jgi:peptidyl-prolyl cis-trans isomerase SurA
MRRYFARGAVAVLGLAAPLAAQDSARVVGLGDVDRIVAVVGRQPIMYSMVEEQFFTYVAQGGAASLKEASDTARVRHQILEDLINEELLVQEALRDTSIKVTDQEVNEQVDQTMRDIRKRFPAEADFQTELGRAGFNSPDEYRRFLFEQSRRDVYKNRLKDLLREKGNLKPVQPTEKEMRAFFEERKSAFGSRPATVSFRQVIIAPKPAAEAKARARVIADSILASLRVGADFATAAKRFSADPGSRERGGDLGWARRGLFVPEFERVVFGMKPGTISDPVETPFGYHLIQTLRTQPGEVQARHILIAPEITEADVDSAKAYAQRVHEALQRGAAIDSLQRRYGDPTEEREASDVPLDKLPEIYRQSLAAAGDSVSIVPPFALEAPGGVKKFAVVQFTERRPEGEIRYEDVRDRVRSVLAEELALRKYLVRLRRATYVDIRAT